MRRVLCALLLLLGLVPATLHAATARTYGVVDAQTDLARFYLGARYYTSQSGRFTTVDPFLDIEAALVDSQRWNRYTYVGNNPSRYVDPFGLYQFEVACGSGDDQCLENQQRSSLGRTACHTAHTSPLTRFTPSRGTPGKSSAAVESLDHARRP